MSTRANFNSVPRNAAGAAWSSTDTRTTAAAARSSTARSTARRLRCRLKAPRRVERAAAALLSARPHGESNLKQIGNGEFWCVVCAGYIVTTCSVCSEWLTMRAWRSCTKRMLLLCGKSLQPLLDASLCTVAWTMRGKAEYFIGRAALGTGEVLGSPAVKFAHLVGVQRRVRRCSA